MKFKNIRFEIIDALKCKLHDVLESASKIRSVPEYTFLGTRYCLLLRGEAEINNLRTLCVDATVVGFAGLLFILYFPLLLFCELLGLSL